MNYTKSEISNNKIEQDMNFIADEIVKNIGKDFVDSIILTGGFARGEGPVKMENEKFFPYNDYDIQIISRKKITKEETDKISTEISKGLGYTGIINFYPFKKEEQKLKDNFYIDLKCYTLGELGKFLPRIRTIELRNNSKVLYGEDKWEELKKLIPDYDLKEIPLSEGAKLLLDRMSQMIEYYSINKKYDKEFLTYIIQQAYAAICTSLLLLDKKYEIGYEKSMNIFKENYKNDFPELYAKIPELDRKIEQFISWKINPQELPNEDAEEEWFIARNNLLEVCKYFFSKFLNKDIESSEELSLAILKMGKEFYTPYISAMRKHRVKKMDVLDNLGFKLVPLLFRYKYNKRMKELGIKFKTKIKSPDLVIFSSLVYLIDSIKKGNRIDSEELNRGKHILSRVYPVIGENWEDISLDYANAYIAFFLQKI